MNMVPTGSGTGTATLVLKLNFSRSQKANKNFLRFVFGLTSGIILKSHPLCHFLVGMRKKRQRM